jgi:membrane-bound lytic murein transglycosylase D
VPSAHPSAEAETGLAQAVFTTVPQGRTFYYKVKRGDTLPQVAARYDVSVQDLKRWNALTRATVAPGQTLRITSDLAPNAAKAKRATGRKAAPTAKPAGTGTTAGAAPKPGARPAKSPAAGGG